jgi:MFS family permease
MLIGCLVALSASLAALGISEHTWTSLALVSLAGLFGGVFNVATITLIQLDTPDEMRGRMFGLLHTLVGGLAPISMGLTGVVADLLDHNVQLIFVVCGACLVVISIVLSSSRQFRSFVSAEPSADQS